MSKKASEILSLLRSDRRKAFRLLYTEYVGMVIHFVKKNSGNEQDGEDIFQECLLALYEKSLENNFTISCTIKTYLYSIARNLWLKEIRNNKQRNKIVDFEKYVEVGVEVESIDIKEDNRSELVKTAMASLGVKCREILLSFYYMNKKMDEIANDMGYTNAANVKNQKYKCMQKLKSLTLQAATND